MFVFIFFSCNFFFSSDARFELRFVPRRRDGGAAVALGLQSAEARPPPTLAEIAASPAGLSSTSRIVCVASASVDVAFDDVF